jgi:glycosyltransferase involved in cell wall biosynthesis
MLIDELTIIVPTKNEAKNIPGFIQTIPAAARLVCVDASDDETPDLLLKLRRGKTTVISSPVRIAAARNLGALNAATKWLLFTDADIRFSSTYFMRLNQMTLVDAAYGPKLSLDDHVEYYQKFSRWQGRFDGMGIPAVSGSNFLVKAETFHRLGGFRPDLLVNEDTELGYRLKKRGFSVKFVPDLIVYASDHRRLKHGALRKDLHTLVRCALLYTELFPGLLSGRDWGYWSKKI